MIAARRSLQAVCMLGAIVAPCAAVAWTKTYVVEWNEPAMYYGAKDGVIDPGTDCPAGTNPEVDWIKVMTTAGYTEEEAQAIARLQAAAKCISERKQGRSGRRIAAPVFCCGYKGGEAFIYFLPIVHQRRKGIGGFAVYS